MLLPYFRPKGGVDLGMVTPGRYLVDTSGALWYYGHGTVNPEVCYLIGSDSPEKRVISAVGGAMAQNNPPFYHELLAALAMLDFHAVPEPQNNSPIRHYSEAAKAGAANESCALSKLPGPGARTQEEVKRQLAYLFHLAAFSLDWRVPASSAYHKGLFQYAKDSDLTGWDKSIHQLLTKDREDLKARGRHCQQLLEYFAHLLLWGETVLNSKAYESSGLAYNPNSGQYSSLHNTLCAVSKDEMDVEVNGRFEQELDNVAARIGRLALAGLVREDATRAGRNGEFRGHKLRLTRNSLLEAGQTIRVGMAPGKLATALASHGFGKAEIDKIFGAYQAEVPPM